jgi:hypothetical protein
MPADVVISAYKRAQSLSVLRDGPVALQIHVLVLERPSEPFHENVAVGPPLPSMLSLAGHPSQLNIPVNCSEVYWHP